MPTVVSATSASEVTSDIQTVDHVSVVDAPTSVKTMDDAYRVAIIPVELVAKGRPICDW